MNIYSQVASNKRGSLTLMVGFVAVIVGFSWIMSYLFETGPELVTMAIIFASISAWIGYYYSDKIVLSMSHAREVSLENNRELYHLLENLCIATGLPMPKLYVIEDSAPNAFATGRDPNHAVICVTTGILKKLDKRELEGVLAHELSHIQNFDIRYMTLVVIFVGMITLLSDWFLRYSFFGGRSRKRDSNSGQLGLILLVLGIVFAILAPLIATLIKLAISRKREFLADASAALITRYPEGLASALLKLDSDKDPLEAANKATQHLYIVSPLKNFSGGMNSLFRTHPPIEERVKRLREM